MPENNSLAGGYDYEALTREVDAERSRSVSTPIEDTAPGGYDYEALTREVDAERTKQWAKREAPLETAQAPLRAADAPSTQPKTSALGAAGVAGARSLAPEQLLWLRVRLLLWQRNLRWPRYMLVDQ